MSSICHKPARCCVRSGGGAQQSGFTLVELMISMVIGLFLVLALTTLLINVSRSNSEMSKTSRVIDNGRLALQLLQSDISHAGFWGGFVPLFDDMTATAAPADYPSALPDPCLPWSTPWTAAHKGMLVGVAVQGYEIPTVVPSPTLAVCASKVLSPKGGTDVLFVRHAETCVTGTGSCGGLADSELYFQVERCGDNAPNPAYALEKYVAANTIIQDEVLFPMRNRTCSASPLADRRKFMSTLYYVRNYTVTAGDGIPALMRSQFGQVAGAPEHKAAEVMIEGIDGFRVEYGIDNLSDSGAAVNFASSVIWANANNKTSPTNRGDGIPDGAFVRCTAASPCSVDQMANTVAVKLYVLVRGETITAGYTDSKTYNLGGTTLGPFNDGFKRHLFFQTIRLTNVSSRRETP